MAGQTVCPRCGALDSFIKGYLPETCVCRTCQSQLGWQEIPGCGPDCTAAESQGTEASLPTGLHNSEDKAADDKTTSEDEGRGA